MSKKVCDSPRCMELFLRSSPIDWALICCVHERSLADVEAIVAQLASGKGMTCDDMEEDEWKPERAQATIDAHERSEVPLTKGGWLVKQGEHIRVDC